MPEPLDSPWISPPQPPRFRTKTSTSLLQSTGNRTSFPRVGVLFGGRFTGQWCDLLNLQAPEDTERGLCHSGFESYHSWGGRALPATETTVTNAADGTAIRETSTTWHLYASFMCKDAHLSPYRGYSMPIRVRGIPTMIEEGWPRVLYFPVWGRAG